jgi:hypothetical protein
VAFASDGLEVIGDVEGDGEDVDRLGSQLDLVRLQARSMKQLVDGAGETRGVLADYLEVLALIGRDCSGNAVQEVVRCPLDHGERCTKIMRHVGNQCIAHAVGFEQLQIGRGQGVVDLTQISGGVGNRLRQARGLFA